MKPVYIEARDLPDAWFQCIYRIFDEEAVHEYTVDRGSFEGHRRREFDLVMVHVKYPQVRPLIPDIPPELGIPSPTSMEYVEEYLQYLMTDVKKENEVYTYGERITNPKIVIDGQERSLGVNPMAQVIDIYRKDKRGTNQAIMEVGMPQGDSLFRAAVAFEQDELHVYRIAMPQGDGGLQPLEHHRVAAGLKLAEVRHHPLS